jgi:sugar O-acyltransferase (sialic acid O-acetyltransferase NeuD family)
LKLLLAGAGGHAKAVKEAICAKGDAIGDYVDSRVADWLDSPRHASDDAALAGSTADGVVLGLGGVSVEQLRNRLALLDRYLDAGMKAPPIVHASATVSETATLQPGVVVLAAAVVQPSATLGRGALVNTGAIVEHDCQIGAGAHVAPGAVVLGGCTIGDCAMIGAGAVVLPNSVIGDGAMVKALSRMGGAGR